MKTSLLFRSLCCWIIGITFMGRAYGVEPSPMALEPTWNDLKQIMITHTPSTVGEALKQLHQHYLFIDHFKNYTLMNHSLSLQEATVNSPRAILFGHAGQLVLTFNDFPQKGAGSLETLAWNPISQQFELREILFKGHFSQEQKIWQQRFGSLKNWPRTILENEFELKTDEIAYESGSHQGYVVTHANPQKCLNCHGLKANPQLVRPLWSFYADWSRARGENDDALSKNEAVEFVRWQKSVLNHPRYGYLKTAEDSAELHDLSRLYPYYLEPEPYNRPTQANERRLSTMPNHRLNLSLSMLYAEQTARWLRKNHPEKVKRTLDLSCAYLDKTFGGERVTLGRQPHEGVVIALLNTEQEILLQEISQELFIDWELFNMDVHRGSLDHDLGRAVPGIFAGKTLRHLIINKIWQDEFLNFKDKSQLAIAQSQLRALTDQVVALSPLRSLPDGEPYFINSNESFLWGTPLALLQKMEMSFYSYFSLDYKDPFLDLMAARCKER